MKLSSKPVIKIPFLLCQTKGCIPTHPVEEIESAVIANIRTFQTVCCNERGCGIYAAQGIEFDTLFLITFQHLQHDSLKSAYHLLAEKKFDAVFTAVAYSYPVQRGLKIDDGKIRMVWPEYRKSRSQDLETIYHDARAI